MSLWHRRSTKAEYESAEHMLESIKHYIPDYEPVVTPKQYERMLQQKIRPDDWNTVRVTEGPPEGVSEEVGWWQPYMVVGTLTFLLGMFLGGK
jgi:hypothetical protein